MDINYLQQENSITNNIIDENIYFEIIYKINQNKTKIFDNKFIYKNKDKCKIIYKNKEYELKEYFEELDNNYKNEEKISLILRIDRNITDINGMFYGCDELLLIRDNSIINYSNNNNLIIKDISNEINLTLENDENTEIFFSLLKKIIYINILKIIKYLH